MRLNPVAIGILSASFLAGGLAACAPASPASPVPTVPPLGGPSPAGSAAPIPVLGTENFYADLLAQIGGARVTATSLLNDPNADPHAFESSTQAALAVADAQLVIVNGLGYDAFMDKLLAASPSSSRSVINVQQLLGLADGANAHIWYDPATMPAVAAKVAAALDAIDPGNAFYFNAREALYVASLQPVTAKIAAMKTHFGGTPVAFTEPVAGYLAAAIGLRVLTPEGFQKSIEDGTDPAPADVAAESDLLTGKQVKVLLYNSQVTSPITTQMHDLAVANGIPVVGVAETIPAAYSDYVSWQLGQLDQLDQALGGGG
ncbi:MAG TPA: zinc ABC transporter substrate-binding protein [Candidatus Limnocylindrales bacterium]|nr:zinc ABC transporter substrate-binding protein [Candidatus Limnocylindrales bacterium]